MNIFTSAARRCSFVRTLYVILTNLTSVLDVLVGRFCVLETGEDVLFDVTSPHREHDLGIRVVLCKTE